MINALKNRGRGFTIVELLIVIVVIAILASITVVAFNGIQDKANNATRIAYARNALGVIQSYRAMNGEYPPLPDLAWSGTTRAACLGEGWPLMNGDAVCWNIYTDGGEKGNSTFPQNDTVNQALSKISKLPNYPQAVLWSGVDGTGRPLYLNAMALVERPTSASETFPLGYSLAYILKGEIGSTNCGISGAEAQAFIRETGIIRCIVPLGA